MSDAPANARLEAFSDGVFAFALTLLIVDVRLAAPEQVTSSAALWQALGRLTPIFFAFLLSFTIIFITWVNHHSALKLIARSTPAFVYANGFLLLTVVAIPFTASLVGDFLGTDHAAPAVLLYNAVLAVQSVAWILISSAARRGGLAVDANAEVTLRANGRSGYLACALYALFAVASLWVPVTVAILTTLSWAFWLLLGIRIRPGGPARRPSAP